MLLLLQEVTSLNSCAQVNALAASYLLVVAPHFRQRGAPRLDGSIMQGVPGAEPAMRRCLVISHSVCNLYMVLTWHLAAFNNSISSNDACNIFCPATLCTMESFGLGSRLRLRHTCNQYNAAGTLAYAMTDVICCSDIACLRMAHYVQM